MTPSAELEAVVMGRVGADLYPNQIGAPLAEVRTYTRYAGGFATNVATGLARLGVSVAIVSKVGDEGHGEFIRNFLVSEGVDVRWLGTDQENLTPIVFCEVVPPDHFPLLFYRRPTAPDWELTVDDIDVEEMARIPLMFISGTGLAREPSRQTTLASALAHEGTTVFDLDWRPSVWDEPANYAEVANIVIEGADVVVGNEEELRAALGADDAEKAANVLIDRGVETVIMKRGAMGVVCFRGDGRLDVPPIETEVMNGLGAGDAFAAALGHGLLRGLPMEKTLQRANAAGAMVASQLPCSEAMPSDHDITVFLQSNSGKD
ncbi:MAG: 5-dehydro-2-deoxygluconokinase [Actinobacteria bacterium]|nr:5-dehydro-2-deoxygluconokinase [Actinomycetota bacterium]MDQ3532032.1 5-dehydro-2-deoxygluconokinase [Actinomycetota bacterium]